MMSLIIRLTMKEIMSCIRYRELADKEKRVIFGGRLGGYKYYDMDKVIKAALEMCSEELV